MSDRILNNPHCVSSRSGEHELYHVQVFVASDGAALMVHCVDCGESRLSDFKITTRALDRGGIEATLLNRTGRTVVVLLNGARFTMDRDAAAAPPVRVNRRGRTI